MKTFDVTVAAESEYLRVTTVGKYDFTGLFPLLDLVKNEATKADRCNVLIDSRGLEGNMTEAERFEGGQKIAELFAGRYKLAVVMPPHTITRLGELTASNRGARFHVTDSEADAIEWLLR